LAVSSNIFDLVVVGAGPAGSAAAITAAKQGIRVLLLEAGAFPRQKVCGEFVSAEAITLLRSLSTADDSLINDALPLPQARLFVDGHKLELPVTPAAIGISRSDLDLALWRSAQQHSVACREKTRIRKVEQRNDCFLLYCGEEEICARAVIDASGRWSELHTCASLAEPEEKWIGIKAHFFEANPNPSCDLYFFREGYCGVLPVKTGADGIVNAAAMVRADAATNFEQISALSAALESRMRHWKPVFSPVTTAPLFFASLRTSHLGMLLAGDAAGFIDPFAGDGISLALHGGQMAATLLSQSLRSKISLPAAQASYDQWYREHLTSAFINARRFRTLLRMPRFVRRIAIHALGMPLAGPAAVHLTRARP
jgi:flavin-dependent dehydrogenase